MTIQQQSSSYTAKASSRESLGIILMITASLLAPCVDGIAKYLSVGMSPLYLAFCRYFVAACLVVPLAASKGELRVLPKFSVNLARTILIVGCMVCFFFAIKLTSLASAFGGFFWGPSSRLWLPLRCSASA